MSFPPNLIKMNGRLTAYGKQMIRKRFSVDLTLECDPEIIEELFEAFCEKADEVDALITQYRYYVPTNEQESKRN